MVEDMSKQLGFQLASKPVVCCDWTDFICQGHKDKVKSRSQYDISYLQPTTNVPTKY